VIEERPSDSPGPGEKRLVILTADGLEHHYVTNRLCHEFQISAILVEKVRKADLKKRLRRYPPAILVSKALRLLFLKATGDKKKARMASLRVFGEDDCNRFHNENLVRRVPGINSPQALSFLKESRPDAILVYGCGIVRDKVLSLAHDLAFNMHTGISPYYRGTACAFWPIVNGEPHRLGATVHECTSVVDGGRIFGTRQARLEADDGIHEAFARCVVVGSELYNDTIRRYLDGTLEGKAQDFSLGKEYRAAMRTLSAEMKARRNIRRGLIRRYCRETQRKAVTE